MQIRLVVAAALWSISPSVLRAQSAVTSTDTSGGYQVRYATNLTAGDSVINLTNSGASSTEPGVTSGAFQDGNLCVHLYAYSPDEQLVSCCSCLVTPNALQSVSVTRDLISNTLTPVIPQSVVVKLLASRGGASATSCNAATAGQSEADRLAPGLEAWGTTLHRLPTGPAQPDGTFGLTETPFTRSTLSEAERQRMTQLCGFIRANGSGYGICKNCRFGGLGAVAK